MISFLDGPAHGQRLNLKRVPRFLRVVQNGAGKWDALDQLDDTALADEKIFAYGIQGQPSQGFVCRAGGRGGPVLFAEYRFISRQPTDEELRSNEKWSAWCQRRAKIGG